MAGYIRTRILASVAMQPCHTRTVKVRTESVRVPHTTQYLSPMLGGSGATPCEMGIRSAMPLSKRVETEPTTFATEFYLVPFGMISDMMITNEGHRAGVTSASQAAVRIASRQSELDSEAVQAIHRHSASRFRQPLRHQGNLRVTLDDLRRATAGITRREADRAACKPFKTAQLPADLTQTIRHLQEEIAPSATRCLRSLRQGAAR